MKLVDGWWWPDGEQHMLEWIANPKNRMILNGRPSYQGKKQLAALSYLDMQHRRTMIDVGAHIGLWSFNFAHWFKKIEAFEPVEAHRECFNKNVLDALAKDGTKTEGVDLRPYALGDHEAMVAISVNPTSSGDSWVKGKGTVPMKTLDSFAFTEVDFIKVDCEGYEEFVLRGAVETIKQWKPFIVVEQKRDMANKFGLKPQGAVKFLEAMGYWTVQTLSGDFFMQHAE